jgi:hypothetical protein
MVLFTLVQKLFLRLLGVEALIKSEMDSLRTLVQQLAQAQEQNAAQRAAEVRALLNQILIAVTPAPAVKFVFTVALDGQITTGVEHMKITASQKFTASIQPVDAKGNPAEVQSGTVQWSGPENLTITPSSDGLSAEIAAKGPLGQGQVSVGADADLGEGVVTITGVLQVEVIAGQAVSLGVSTSEPVEQ